MGRTLRISNQHNQDDRYSLVHFNQYQEPNWSFISKEKLEETYPEFDFHVSRKSLEN
jgi:hypothetical protein